MKKYLLTICILVRNQESDVVRILSKLLPKKSSEIQVIIRDGGSNNKSKPYISEPLRRNAIEYRHIQNEEIDQKIINSIRDAQGEFVWLFGDDDLAEGALNEVLGLIKKFDKLNFIWANFKLLDSNEKAVDLGESRFFRDKNELLQSLGLSIGFISSCVFRRSCALGSSSLYRPHLGTGFVGLFIVLKVITEYSGHYYIDKPVVICHPRSADDMRKIITTENGKTNNRCFEVFGVNFTKIIKSYGSEFSKPTIDGIVMKAFNQAWKGVFVGWMGGWDSPSGNRKMMIKNFWHFPSCWLALFIFSLPFRFNKFLYSIYTSTKWRK